MSAARVVQSSPVPRPPALRASPTPSDCPAAAVPGHTPASSKLCTSPSESCDGAVRCACTAWGLSVTGLPLYPSQPAAETDLCTKAAYCRFTHAMVEHISFERL